MNYTKKLCFCLGLAAGFIFGICGTLAALQDRLTNTDCGNGNFESPVRYVSENSSIPPSSDSIEYFYFSENQLTAMANSSMWERSMKVNMVNGRMYTERRQSPLPPHWKDAILVGRFGPKDHACIVSRDVDPMHYLLRSIVDMP